VGPDGTLYFGTMSATAYAVDCHGQELWSWSFPCDGWNCPQAFEGSPALGVDGTVYVADDIATPNYLFALEPAGTLKWTWETESVAGSMDASPALGADGTIWVAGHGFSGYEGPYGQVAAVHPDGTTVGLFPVGTSGPLLQSPVVIGDSLYVVETTGDAAVKAVGPAAVVFWETALTPGGWDSNPGDLAVDPEGAIVAATVVDMGGGMGPLLVVKRLAAETGEVLWEVSLEVHALRVVGGPVIRVAQFGFEIAVALADGTTVLANPYSGGVKISTLAGPVDPLYQDVMRGGPAWGDDGALYVPRPIAMGEAPAPGILRIVPGPQVEEEHFALGALPGTVKTSLQIAPGGMVYAGMDDGRLVAWRSFAEGPEPNASWPTERRDPENTGRGE